MVNNRNKEWICMLLAGGQGSRLYALTRDVAKPAVSFGGKYRIIDFALSNCANSGVDTVGVLTQYRPLLLNDYIGSGQAWDLDRLHGGVHILPPYQKQEGYDWYKGTANAVCQNIHFIEKFQPEHVLILSGDHIYKMDYAKMLKAHKKNNADCTIAVIDVPIEEASRFGIMNADETGKIYEFEEKPAHPKSTMASMGVYMFTWKTLREYLLADEANPDSSNDFGHDLIPAMHSAGERLFAYPFDGYWKDVGTIDSLWEANLDLLNPKVDLDLADPDWKIYSNNLVTPPHYISSSADVQNSLVAGGCKIDGTVDFSILFANVTVEKGAVIKDSIVMPGCVVKEGAVVQYAIVAENAVIDKKAVVGKRPEDMENLDEWGVSVVGANVTIGKKCVVPPKAMIDTDMKGGDSNEG